jgi:hypothetical protein
VLTNANGLVSSQVRIDQLLQDHGGNAGSITTNIIGGGFQIGSTVKLTGLGPDIVGVNTAVQQAVVLTTVFDLRGAPPGVRSVVVTNPGPVTAMLANAFTIEQGGASHVWIDVLGFNFLRMGRPQRYTLMYGNKGNVDAPGGHFWLSFPSALTWKIEFGPQPTAAEVLNNGNVLLGFDILPVPAGSTGTILFSLQAPLTFTAPFRLRAWTNQP